MLRVKIAISQARASYIFVTILVLVSVESFILAVKLLKQLIMIVVLFIKFSEVIAAVSLTLILIPVMMSPVLLPIADLIILLVIVCVGHPEEAILSIVPKELLVRVEPTAPLVAVRVPIFVIPILFILIIIILMQLLKLFLLIFLMPAELIKEILDENLILVLVIG